MPAKTIDEIIARLEAIVQSSTENGNPPGIFAIVYLDVTKSVKTGILENRFDDGHRMERLDVIFASRYLDAYDQFQQKLPCTHAWKTAFEAANHHSLIILQHLLMGMNAHINLDLGIAAAEAVSHEELPDLEGDFFKINQLLTEQIDAMQDKLSRISPLLFLLDWFGKKSDEKFAEFSLKKARGHAWTVAHRLSKLPGEEKSIAIDELDGYVTVLNRLLTEPGVVTTSILKMIKWFEMKDVKKIMESLASPGPQPLTPEGEPNREVHR